MLVSVGESANRYSEVAVHLQNLLGGSAYWSESEVEIAEDSNIETLADGFSVPNPEDIVLREKVAEGFSAVVRIATITQTPTGTIEYSDFGGGPINVYDDPPFDNEYFAPEVFYEGCTQLSKLILNAGSTPLIFLPQNTEEAGQIGKFLPEPDQASFMYASGSRSGTDAQPASIAVTKWSSPATSRPGFRTW